MCTLYVISSIYYTINNSLSHVDVLYYCYPSNLVWILHTKNAIFWGSNLFCVEWRATSQLDTLYRSRILWLFTFIYYQFMIIHIVIYLFISVVFVYFLTYTLQLFSTCLFHFVENNFPWESSSLSSSHSNLICLSFFI